MSNSPDGRYLIGYLKSKKGKLKALGIQKRIEHHQLGRKLKKQEAILMRFKIREMANNNKLR